MELFCCHNYVDTVDLYYLATVLDKSVEEVKEMAGTPCHSKAVTIYQGYALCQKHYTARLEEQFRFALTGTNIFDKMGKKD